MVYEEMAEGTLHQRIFCRVKEFNEEFENLNSFYPFFQSQLVSIRHYLNDIRDVNYLNKTRLCHVNQNEYCF